METESFNTYQSHVTMVTYIQQYDSIQVALCTPYNNNNTIYFYQHPVDL
jgi:hypothetical protein